MNDPRGSARQAAMRLEDEGGPLAVQEAAREALTNEVSGHMGQNLPSYHEAVSCFWAVRARYGIPAVRDILWSLNISTDGL